MIYANASAEFKTTLVVYNILGRQINTGSVVDAYRTDG